MTYEQIERPPSRPKYGRSGLTDQLRMTVDTGKALILPLERYKTLYGGIQRRLRDQGYRLCRQRQGGCVVAWCVKVKP
jgi:hypothetical protein